MNPWSALSADMRSNRLEIATGREVASQNRDAKSFSSSIWVVRDFVSFRMSIPLSSKAIDHAARNHGFNHRTVSAVR
jgi:hypothetical protein